QPRKTMMPRKSHTITGVTICGVDIRGYDPSHIFRAAPLYGRLFAGMARSYNFCAAHLHGWAFAGMARTKFYALHPCTGGISMAWPAPTRAGHAGDWTFRQTRE